jgi:hypothetical protein
VISGFRHDIDEIYALPRYYAASSGNPLPTFQDNRILDGTDTLSQNVGKGCVISQKSADLKMEIDELRSKWCIH